MSDYPNEPRPRGGWPAQPPRYSEGAGGREPHGPGDDVPAAPPRRRRRRRVVTVLIVLAVFLAALFAAGDRIAVAYAQNAIASQIQAQAHLSARPSVTIKGFPFLTQVLARDVRQVDISASDVREGNVTIATITATATGVHISSGFNGARIDQVNGTALITYASLESALPSPLNRATIAPDPSAGRGGVKVSLGGGLATATGQVTLTSPATVTLSLDHLGGLAGLLGGGLSQTTFPFTIPALPAGLKVTGLSVASQGIDLTATAHDTTLSRQGSVAGKTSPPSL